MKLPKMNKTLKRKWLAALRSGKYRRAQAQLKDDRGHYCCLGVLCKVTGTEFEPEDTFLPWDISNRARLDRETQEVLACLNDGEYHTDSMKDIGPVKRYAFGRGAPFTSIADFIEKHL